MLPRITVVASEVVSAAEFDSTLHATAVENHGAGNSLPNAILQVHDITSIIYCRELIIVVRCLPSQGHSNRRASSEDKDLPKTADLLTPHKVALIVERGPLV